MNANMSAAGSVDEVAALAEASRQGMARLMAVAGHDLKQPLQVAMLSLVRAVGEGLPVEAARRLRIALDAMKRLGAELDDIARLSQREDALRPQPRAVLLDDVLAQVERDWRVYAEACGTRLEIRWPTVFVETDPVMLRTILRNLVGNAIKYSGPRGHVHIGWRLRGDTISVDVHDDGGGIPAANLARIFDAFERGDQQGRSEGLGLGLTIVRQTAELLRHPVSVRSVENEGSTFSVELPLLSRPYPRVVDIETAGDIETADEEPAPASASHGPQ